MMAISAGLLGAPPGANASQADPRPLHLDGDVAATAASVLNPIPAAPHELPGHDDEERHPDMPVALNTRGAVHARAVQTARHQAVLIAPQQSAFAVAQRQRGRGDDQTGSVLGRREPGQQRLSYRTYRTPANPSQVRQNLLDAFASPSSRS